MYVNLTSRDFVQTWLSVFLFPWGSPATAAHQNLVSRFVPVWGFAHLHALPGRKQGGHSGCFHSISIINKGESLEARVNPWRQGWIPGGKGESLGILAHLLRMVVEPKYFAFWRWLDTPAHPLTRWARIPNKIERNKKNRSFSGPPVTFPDLFQSLRPNQLQYPTVFDATCGQLQVTIVAKNKKLLVVDGTHKTIYILHVYIWYLYIYMISIRIYIYIMCIYQTL